MSRWSNFSIWRGRLPHWRADGVSYFVTFRHRRQLEDDERAELLRCLLRSQGKRWDLEALIVLADKTELICRVEASPSGDPFELSDIVEKAKARAGKGIVKASGERYPPFYGESYDRIIRDEEEHGQLWDQIVRQGEGDCSKDDPQEYRFLWLQGAP